MAFDPKKIQPLFPGASISHIRSQLAEIDRTMKSVNLTELSASTQAAMRIAQSFDFGYTQKLVKELSWIQKDHSTSFLPLHKQFESVSDSFLLATQGLAGLQRTIAGIQSDFFKNLQPSIRQFEKTQGLMGRLHSNLQFEIPRYWEELADILDSTERKAEATVKEKKEKLERAPSKDEVRDWEKGDEEDLTPGNEMLIDAIQGLKSSIDSLSERLKKESSIALYAAVIATATLLSTLFVFLYSEIDTGTGKQSRDRKTTAYDESKTEQAAIKKNEGHIDLLAKELNRLEGLKYQVLGDFHRLHRLYAVHLDKVKLYTHPKPKASVVDQLSKYDLVVLVENKKKWARIAFQSSKTGQLEFAWIRKKHLKRVR